ncbi:MAG: hypothetical protein Q4F84_00730 [Fibrobacter sp.]|nr:hypothetical protein [Fibrobacter sp.]
MSSNLYHFLLEAYEDRHVFTFTKDKSSSNSIQIDDQGDEDRLDEFCSIFCVVDSGDNFQIELSGNIPITKEISDLAEIYDGYSDQTIGKVVLKLNTDQVDALITLADKIRKTSFSGPSINNHNWISISARTISSLHRFVRTIKEYRNTKKTTRLDSLLSKIRSEVSL